MTSNRMSLPVVRLKRGRERSLLRRHPWVFSGAVESMEGNPSPGSSVDVRSADGTFLGRGAISPVSQIRLRIWTWDEQEAVDVGFLRARLQQALAARDHLPFGVASDAHRLVHSESDRLPGLIVDRYGDLLVVQFLTCGVEFWRAEISEILLDLSGAAGIYERSDAESRSLEGLTPREGWLGGDVPEKVTISEGGLRFEIDFVHGHKTGFYLDQRANRAFLRTLADRKEVLDCFCYTGGFTVNAIAGGASSVLAVDSSASVLEQATRNLALNGLPAEKVTFQEGDVFHVLRDLRDRARRFDLIVLDPPKFAATLTQAEKAARGYKDINLLALKLLHPGGRLLTFSCSGGVSPDLFQKIVAGAALDAGVEARILARLSQDMDHPVALTFPEGEYLKGLLVEV